VSGGLKVARIGEEDVPSLLLQRVARFQVGPDLDSDFLYAFLRSSAFTEAIRGHDYSLGVPHVSPRQVASVTMPAPPIAEQHEIVLQLRQRLTLIDRLARAISTQAESLEALPAAILSAAFDEPALAPAVG
jgi:type I restriction enzyme S subunit